MNAMRYPETPSRPPLNQRVTGSSPVRLTTLFSHQEAVNVKRAREESSPVLVFDSNGDSSPVYALPFSPDYSYGDLKQKSHPRYGWVAETHPYSGGSSDV